MTNSFSGIKTLGAYLNTVHNAVTAEYTEWIVEIRKAVLGTRISCVSQESVGLQQT